MVINCPAKINLYLHVIGKQSNGYHELDSIFVKGKEKPIKIYTLQNG